MNCIYLYENLDKPQGARYYIGSKVECELGVIDGLDTIVDIKTGAPYYGSSKNPAMSEDMSRGDRFSATILEKVDNRDLIRHREQYYLEKNSAADNPDYYNLSANAFAAKVSHDAPVNFLGEKLRDYTKSKSTISRRDRFAEECGFNNCGELYLHAQKLYDSGVSHPEISAKFGKNRHYFTRALSIFEAPRALEEIEKGLDKAHFTKIRELLDRNVSIHKIAEHLDLSLTTVRYAAGDYYHAKSRKSFKGTLNTAFINGLTEEELLDTIGLMCIEGYSRGEISEKLNISRSSVGRHLQRLIRSKMNFESFPKAQKRFLKDT